MTGLVDAVVPLVVAAGLVLGALALIATRRSTVGLPVLLDFLLAAGLLRLSATSSWQTIATAAGVVALRKITTAGISAGRRVRAPLDANGAPPPRGR